MKKKCQMVGLNIIYTMGFFALPSVGQFVRMTWKTRAAISGVSPYKWWYLDWSKTPLYILLKNTFLN